EGGQKWGAAPLLPSGEAFQYPNACAMLKQATPPPGTLTCVTGPGEMLLLPDEWIHATCGLTEFTAAAGGWLAYHDD
ncbi:FCA1, partial [Symbiodinium microadriaticum]